MIRPLIWKELLELARDYRTLAALAVLPLLMLPLLGLMATSLQSLEQGSLLIVVNDTSSGYLEGFRIDPGSLVENISSSMRSKGYIVQIGGPPSSPVDVILTIPQGFSRNLSSLGERAFLEIQRIPGSPRAERLLQDLYSELSRISSHISMLRIEALARRAGESVDPSSVRDPLLVLLTAYIAPSGREISGEEAARLTIARLLSFSLVFVATPATTYVVDSILGEKERRTLEILLMAPLRKRDLIAAKAISSSAVGLLAALIEVAAVIVFLSIIARGSPGIFDPGLVAVSGLAVYLTILATLALSLPVIVRSATVRTAQIYSSTITIIASSIFFSALFVDIERLPQPVGAILMIAPYTHSVLIIRLFASGDLLGSLIHAVLLAGFSAVFIILSARLLDEEKILLRPA